MALEQIIESMDQNSAFNDEYAGRNNENTYEYVIVYGHWIIKQKKLLKDREKNTDILFLKIFGNTNFLEFVSKNHGQNRAEACRESIGTDHPKPPDQIDANMKKFILNEYSEWIDEMLNLLEATAKERLLMERFGHDTRQMLMEQQENLYEQIKNVKEKKKEYKLPRAQKWELKKNIVNELNLGLRTRILSGKQIKTTWLLRRMQNQRQSLINEINRIRPNYRENTANFCQFMIKMDLLTKIDGWIKDLSDFHFSKEEYKVKQDLVRQEQKVLDEEAKAHGAEFKKRLKETSKDDRKEQNQVFRRIEDEIEELDRVVEQKAGSFQRIDELESLLADIRNKYSSNDPSLQRWIASIEEDYQIKLEKEKQAYKILSVKENRLLHSIHHQNLILKTITETLDRELSDEESLEKKRLALKQHVKDLKSIKANPRSMNIYCTFFDFSYPLVLLFGQMAGGEKCGFGRFEEKLQGQGGAVREASAERIIKRFAKGLGLPKKLMDYTGYDTGLLRLTFNAGLFYGIGISESAVARVGAVLQYDAELILRDDRSFMASSTLVLKALAEAKVKGTDPSLFNHKEFNLLSASLAADLVTTKTTYIFSDQYHWAAWFCQKWANLAAKAMAFDYVYSGNHFQQPTPESIALMLATAERFMQENDRIQMIMKDIAWFMQEDIVYQKSLTTLSKLEAGVAVLAPAKMDAQGGAKVAGDIGLHNVRVDQFRYKRSPDGNIVYDKDTHLPMELTRKTDFYTTKVEVTVPGILFNISYTLSDGYEKIEVTLVKKAGKAVKWVTGNVTQINEALETMSSIIGTHLNSATYAIPHSSHALQTVGDSARAILQSVANAIPRVMNLVAKKVVGKLIFDTNYNWGYYRVPVSPGKKRWQLCYQRKVGLTNPYKTRGVNHSITIPTPIGEFFVDLGFDYLLNRANKESLSSETFYYLGMVYRGLTRRRRHDGTKFQYNSRLANLFFLGLLGLSGAPIPKGIIGKVNLFPAESGRPDGASGDPLWEKYLKEKGVMNSIMKMFCLIATGDYLSKRGKGGWSKGIASPTEQNGPIQIGGNRQASPGGWKKASPSALKDDSSGAWQKVSPSAPASPRKIMVGHRKYDKIVDAVSPDEAKPLKPEDIEKYHNKLAKFDEKGELPPIYLEVFRDKENGVAGAGELIARCRQLETTFKKFQPRYSKLELFGTNAWVKTIVKFLKGERDDESKIQQLKDDMDGIKKTTTEKIFAEKEYWKIVPYLTTYIKGKGEAESAEIEKKWRVVAKSDLHKRIQKEKGNLIGDRFQDAVGYLNDLNTLMYNTGATRKLCEKALRETKDIKRAEQFVQTRLDRRKGPSKKGFKKAGKVIARHGVPVLVGGKLGEEIGKKAKIDKPQ